MIEKESNFDLTVRYGRPIYWNWNGVVYSASGVYHLKFDSFWNPPIFRSLKYHDPMPYQDLYGGGVGLPRGPFLAWASEPHTHFLEWSTVRWAIGLFLIFLRATTVKILIAGRSGSLPNWTRRRWCWQPPSDKHHVNRAAVLPVYVPTPCYIPGKLLYIPGQDPAISRGCNLFVQNAHHALGHLGAHHAWNLFVMA